MEVHGMKKKQKLRKVRVYEKPSLAQIHKDKPEKLILACDPGTANFGIALVGLVKGKPRVYANAVMMRPMNDLKKVNKQGSQFKLELAQWLSARPGGIIAERFQTRGIGGTTIETVSCMLGILSCFGLPMKAVVASQWKNEFKRRFGQDLKELYPTVSVAPHQLDAALIGIYGLEQGMGTKFEWEYKSIFKQVESTALEIQETVKEPL
jgi:hypothetical protein